MSDGVVPQLRPSAISGLVRLRNRLFNDPGLSAEVACKLLASSYDGAGLDMAGAIVLHRLVSPEVIQRDALYRDVIRIVAVRNGPSWCSLLRSGRDALQAVDLDVRVCFERAGAFEAMPGPAVVRWWDELASLAYIGADMARMEVGREAERLSLAYEQTRLSAFSGSPSVIWKSLDANAAGYDLQSWDCIDGQWMPKYIEVKGSRSPSSRLHLTRHEWDTALRHGAAYCFQIWDLGASKMQEVTVSMMADHVPADHGNGIWEEVRIHPFPKEPFELGKRFISIRKL